MSALERGGLVLLGYRRIIDVSDNIVHHHIKNTMEGRNDKSRGRGCEVLPQLHRASRTVRLVAADVEYEACRVAEFINYKQLGLQQLPARCSDCDRWDCLVGYWSRHPADGALRQLGYAKQDAFSAGQNCGLDDRL